MPLLLPLLSRYWKPLIIGGAVLILGGYIWLLRHELADCQLHVAMFKAVQARNEEAIQAQNRAVRKMWADRKKAEAASVVASGILAKAVVESQQPIRFTQKATCEDDVRKVFLKLRGEKP